MADFDYKFGNFEPDSSGIMELFKSQNMQNALMEAARNKASEANARARSTTRWGLKHDPYGPDTKVLSKTAIGRVNTKSKQAAYLDAKHHILNSVNH